MIAASKDSVLTPELAAGMGQYFDNLTTHEVNASHWILVQTPREVNNLLQTWFDEQVFKRKSVL